MTRRRTRAQELLQPAGKTIVDQPSDVEFIATLFNGCMHPRVPMRWTIDRVLEHLKQKHDSLPQQ